MGLLKHDIDVQLTQSTQYTKTRYESTDSADDGELVLNESKAIANS